MPRTRSETLFLVGTTGLIGRLRRAVAEAVARRRDRQLLSQLDQHLLRDIGLLPEDARTEAAKPFWRP